MDVPPSSVMMVFLCIVFPLFSPKIAEAKIRQYRWEAKHEFKSPDCFNKLVITLNGKTPGPTIKAQQGDTIIVDLKNSLLTENIAIHWHGIRQIGSPWSDGTEGVTQCPILPGKTFRYQFVVDRSGTYMYHSHYGMQREAGVYGSIQVAVSDSVKEPFSYDEDQNIILSDWYHRSTSEQMARLSARPFQWVGEPQSLLIQGRGRFNCSLLNITTLAGGVCNTANPECSPYVLRVVPGKTYRLRIGSMTSLSALSFEIERHNMTVVEADGHYVEPFVVKNLNIYSGETYSVLVKADQDPSRNYWVKSSIVARNPVTSTGVTPPGIAIFNYHSNNPKKLPPTVLSNGPRWNNTDSRLAQSVTIKSRQGHIIPPPLSSDRVIILLNTQNEIDGYRKWALNNISFALPNTPYLVALRDNLGTHLFDQRSPNDTYDVENYDIFKVQPNANTTASNSIYRLKFNTTVDIILQNANTMNPNNSETHPWHLHGHDFWVLGYGKGKFDPINDPKKYNLVNPIMKNTVPVHPFGWTALRFQADNPGVWAFHCHIEAHFYMGMGVVFEEGVKKVAELPSSTKGCGDTRVRH
ncbi:L-ascorbate oxidase [Ranunculus cassubicifolius]